MSSTVAVDVIEDPPYDKKEQKSWYWYDWANSAFTTTVVTLFFGPYITSIAKAAADANGNIDFFGFKLDHGSYWATLVSLSVMTQVLVLPVLGSIADSSPRKKWLLGCLAYTGSLATMAMFFLQGDHYFTGGQLFLVANLCFGAGNVVYNSFLPEIASEEDRNAVSSKGYAMGYVGGGLLLAINLVLFMNAEKIGLSTGLAVRMSLASAGFWWAGFALIPLFGLKKRTPRVQRKPGENIVLQGFIELGHTVKDLFGYKQTLLYLCAYLFFNDAIQTVITLAGQFGAEELKIEQANLTAAILMVQLVAFPGAMIFKWLADKITAKWAIFTALALWTAVVFSMYAFVNSTTGFFIAAAVVALVMGGSQALSRSVFSLMIPKGREAQYFSLYEISDKGTSWLGPAIFAIVRDQTKSYRTGILSLIALFVIGMILLWMVDVKRATREAGNEPV
jgi:MFS transporter, UMF1 family